MKSISEILQDADPLRSESPGREEARERTRRAVLAAASRATPAAPGRIGVLRSRGAVLTAVAALLVAMVVLGSKSWTGGGATLHAAAVRLEVRLAETQPTIGLRAVRVAGSGATIYL